MPRRLAITFAVFVLAFSCVLGAGMLAEPSTAVLPLSGDSPCPVTACASGACHGLDDVPEPDGVHEMACPEASCSSTECHAWDALVGRYHRASDASLTLWILCPVLLVLVLVVVAGRIGGKGNGVREAPAAPCAREGGGHEAD